MIIRQINTTDLGVVVPVLGNKFKFDNDPTVYVTAYNSDCTKCDLGTEPDKCVMIDCSKNIRLIKDVQKL